MNDEHVNSNNPVESGANSTNAPLAVWSKSALATWLADHGGHFFGAMELLNQIAHRLVATGVPLARANMLLRDSHPQISARAFTWTREGGSQEVAFPVNENEASDYLESPIAVIHNGASGVRRRLEGPDVQVDFSILHTLQKEGMTDYVAMPLVFSDRSRHFISWATDQPGGFSVEQLTFLYDLMPLICLRLEVDHSRVVTRTLLNTYLGGGASERVIGGVIRRNEGEVINAIIVYCDLRGFTRMADTLPPQELIQTLGEYYEAVAQPIEASGGDIIKIVGDGLLAIFPTEDPLLGPCDNQQARQAVAAVKEAHNNLCHIPRDNLPKDIDALRAGFALHIGPVTFGNVGSTSRLDFTVIGPAVNEATRVEAMTKSLGYPILTTSAFANLDCSVDLISLGEHPLRGVRQAKEIFTLKELYTDH